MRPLGGVQSAAGLLREGGSELAAQAMGPPAELAEDSDPCVR